MYKCTFTLFNYHAATGMWHTSVFEDADLISLRAGNATQHGNTSGDSVEIIIHTKADKSAVTINDVVKQYAGPKAYARLADPSSAFTFTPQIDFIMAGNHALTGPVSEEDYESGLYHSMNDEYDEVYMVTAATHYALLPHFEIGGK